MRILVVEDEPKMASLIRRSLERATLAVDVAPDGEEALWRAEAVAYDAIVLDRMLPGIDGTEVCRRLRAAGVWSPVLMLTAMGEVPDRIGGLDAGADDYMAKPFDFDELLARLRALAARGSRSMRNSISACASASSRRAIDMGAARPRSGSRASRLAGASQARSTRAAKTQASRLPPSGRLIVCRGMRP